MSLSGILHALLDELDGAIGNVRKDAGANLGPVDAVIAKIRQHADAEAAELEHQAVADGEQLGTAAVDEVKTDAAEAAPVVEQAVESTVADLSQTATTTTAPVAAPAPVATATAVPTDGVVTPEQAPATDTAPAAPNTDAPTPA